MLLAALLSLAAGAAAPVSLALPGLNAVNLAAGEGELYTELLAQKLDGLGLKVVTSRDIGAALGLDRQRALLGCAEASCTAELAGALGVAGLVVGDVGKLGASYAVNLKVLSDTGGTLALFNAEGAEVRPIIEEGARALAHQLAVAMNRPELEPKALTPQVQLAAPRGSVLRPLGIAAIAAGVAALAIGVGCELAANGKLSALRQAETEGRAAQLRDEGKAWQGAGGALLAAGGAIAVAGARMLLLGDGAPKPAVALLPGGAALAFTARWP